MALMSKKYLIFEQIHQWYLCMSILKVRTSEVTELAPTSALGSIFDRHAKVCEAVADGVGQLELLGCA